MSTLQAFIIIIALTFLATIVDYFLKNASLEAKLWQNKWFIAGCLIYAFSAFGWAFAFRYIKLATVGVVYSLATILLLTTLGVWVFGERLNFYETAGIVFAVLSIMLLARFGR